MDCRLGCNIPSDDEQRQFEEDCFHPMQPPGCRRTIRIVSMGRKDASGIKSVPIQQYRKQIGKHDYIKEKRKMKLSKTAQDLKNSSSPFKDSVLIIVTGLVAIVSLYFILYWYLNRELPTIALPDDVQKES